MNKPPMPAQPKTKEIPTVHVVREPTLREVATKLDNLAGTVETLAGHVFDFGQQVTALSDRVSRQSDRARQPSEHDLQAAAELANERAAREALTAKVASIETKTDEQTKMIAQNTALTQETLGALKGAFKHPAVQAFIFAVLGFITAWLTRHT